MGWINLFPWALAGLPQPSHYLETYEGRTTQNVGKFD